MDGKYDVFDTETKEAVSIGVEVKMAELIRDTLNEKYHKPRWSIQHNAFSGNLSIIDNTNNAQFTWSNDDALIMAVFGFLNKNFPE